ncbi:MAG: Mov34/MPN/PAD-1 family protein, partial [Nitrosopumilaceae archaeon]
ISNEELIKVYEEAEKRQLDVVGIFHSHPDSSAYPSLTDQKYMEINPVPWIIFSNKNGEFKAYVFDSKIISVDLTVL